MKLKFYLLTIIFSLIIWILPVNGLEIDLKSENIILYNLKDDNILYKKNSDKNTHIASLTKIVTVLVALENINDINNKVVLTEEVFEGLAEADASVAGFNINETVSYEDLLYGAMLPSGADATKALAINLFKNEQNFVNKMNELMIKLNIHNTYFTNTSGLDEEGQKATLEDLLTIILYAFENDEFIKIFNTKSYITYSGRLNLKSTLDYYENKFNINADLIKGAKTGYTDLAGLALLSYASKDDVELLLITTNAPVNELRYPYNITDALSVYNYYFKNYTNHTIINKNEILTKIPTQYSNSDYANLIYKEEDFKYYLPVDYNQNDLVINFDLIDNVSYKTDIKKSVGAFTILYQDDEIFNGELYLSDKVNFSLITFMKVNYDIFIYLTGMIVFIILIKRKRIYNGNR